MNGQSPRPELVRTATASAAAMVAAALFYSTLLWSGPLDHFDWSGRNCHYFDWVRVSLVRHHTLPLYMVDARVTKNFIGNPEAPTLGPLVWLLPLLGTDAYIKLLIVVFTAAGLMGMLLLLRDFGVEPVVALAPAVAFAMNGFVTSHLAVGHHWAMGVQLLPGLVWLLRCAVRGSGPAVWWAAGLNAFSILGGQHQSFVWQNGILGAYALLLALQRRSLLPLLRLGQILAWTAGLAAVKLLPVLAEFSDYRPEVRTPGLPLDQLLFALVGRGQGPATHVPGLEFRGGAGWWEYAFYVGPIALVCLAVGLLALRRLWPLTLIGVFCFAIAIDATGGFDPWTWLVDLPVWRTQRSPSRFLFFAIFALLVAAGVGMQRIHAWARERRPRAAACAAGAAAVLLFADLMLESQTWQRAAVGKAFESRDHHPRRDVIEAGPKVEAALREFSPNRLVYRVAAGEPGRIVFPFRYAKGAAERERRGEEPGRSEWRIDGVPAISKNGHLAVAVPAGTRELVLTYRPRFFIAGAAVSTASLLALAFAIARRYSGVRS